MQIREHSICKIRGHGEVIDSVNYFILIDVESHFERFCHVIVADIYDLLSKQIMTCNIYTGLEYFLWC